VTWKRGIAALLLLGGCATSGDETLDQWQAGDSYFLTVGASKLVVTMPKDRLAADASQNPSPRYFSFSSKADGLIVSGWFEPDREYPGVEARWKETAERVKNQGLPEPRDVQIGKVGIWDVMSYELHIANLTNTDLFAEYVQAGTWLELHLSTASTGSASDHRAKLVAYLQRISVTEK
jgi:hypothetical protein